MPLSFADIVGMYFRRTPIRKIRSALAKCEEARLAVTVKDLESHYLCGRDPSVLVDALIAAKELNVETTFQEMSAVALAGHEPMKVLQEAAKIRTKRIDTFSPSRDDRIVGFTKNQKEVSAVVTIVYRLSPVQIAFEHDLRYVHERLGAAVSVFINTASDWNMLQIRKAEHESELLRLGVEMLPRLESIAIEFR